MKLCPICGKSFYLSEVVFGTYKKHVTNCDESQFLHGKSKWVDDDLLPVIPLILMEPTSTLFNSPTPTEEVKGNGGEFGGGGSSRDWDSSPVEHTYEVDSSSDSSSCSCGD